MVTKRPYNSWQAYIVSTRAQRSGWFVKLGAFCNQKAHLNKKVPMQWCSHFNQSSLRQDTQGCGHMEIISKCVETPRVAQWPPMIQGSYFFSTTTKLA